MQWKRYRLAKQGFTAFALLLLFAACGNETLIDEEREFAGDRWNRMTPEVFELNVKDSERYYKIGRAHV